MDHPNFWLSDLKFARLHPGSDLQPNAQMPLPSFRNPVQDPAQIQNEPQDTYSASSLNDIDKLKQDKPGEEMASDATIWRLYKKEAMEHDSELVEGRNKNLDTMLLFAGLFSAVLTAFLAGSIGMLKQDPADVTVSLLLDIARSQQRLEQGTAMNSSSLVDVPPFSPDLYARWINGFWFMALTLSLAAAMVAMLAKEWLSAFTASHMCPPHAYALNRQARLDSLYSWYTLPIIDFLPTLLHVSLLLFMLGLLFNLWLLDHAIAIVIGSVGGIMVLLYMAIIVLGATKKLCPFHTRVSRYLRSLYEVFGHNPSKWEEEEEDHTTGEDILALRWLADNARDPSTADSAYQALAGLHSRPIRHPSKDDPKALHKDQEAVLTAFAWIQTRLLSLHERYPRQIAIYRGENAARYAGALVALYTGSV